MDIDDELPRIPHDDIRQDLENSLREAGPDVVGFHLQLMVEQEDETVQVIADVTYPPEHMVSFFQLSMSALRHVAELAHACASEPKETMH